MPLTPLGLYESLITEGLSDRLGGISGNQYVVRDALRAPEVADRMALHLGHIVERAMELVPEKERAARGIQLSRQIIDLINQSIGDEAFAIERPVAPGEVLRAVQQLLPDGSQAALSAPLTPLLDTTLLTNAPQEPRVGAQLLSELGSADRIDIVMAFVRMSGIRPFLAALKRHCESGRSLRVLTTTYTGSTELRALEALADAGAEVRVSYELGGTRLHAKAWLFHRGSGFSTAYVGSSNLTHQAQVSGLEWNVRISGARNPGVIRQIEAIFESYWNGQDFRTFDSDEFRSRVADASPQRAALSLVPLDLRLEPFQQRLLEQIALARSLDHHRNLLVSATGTGKTVMAAMDYAGLRSSLPRSRLLFIAHREEILSKSRDTFRIALRDPSFGETWVGGQRPTRFEHVFASIQSLSHADLGNLAPDHFDVVVVDEFHHAAAPSYERLLAYLAPKELLGLTATPERADGLSVLRWFDGRIAAELGLWDAVDQQRLAPFVYYGIHDGLDLRQIGWKRGRGYDVDELSKLITGDHMVARLILKQVALRVDDPRRMRALGFCVSVEHARFMAAQFTAAGITSLAVWADTPAGERQSALRDLADGRVSIVFTVDLFNEGLDVPTVDTLLMMRPTESATLFLQQLGRGLRRSPGKAFCTVLDFVGHHRQEFRYDQRFRALLGGRRKQVVQQIEQGFPLLPAGCHMELDPVAQKVVLDSIRNAVPDTPHQRVAALREWSLDGAPTLKSYLDETDIGLEDIYYQPKACWSALLEAAGFEITSAGPAEPRLRSALGRMLHIDDLERLRTFQRWLSKDSPPDLDNLSPRDLRLARMLAVCFADQQSHGANSLAAGLQELWDHPQVRDELSQLLDVLVSRVEHVGIASNAGVEPLQVHARYTRLEILAALGQGEGIRTPTWREGVYWAEDCLADAFVFTHDKSAGHFSPTTRYRDYAISPNLIHWESQSRTRANSPTGLRYQQHVKRGSRILLFARKTSDDRAFYFLGPATYVKHESEAPMAITWRLDHPLPGDLFAEFAAAIA